MNLLTIFLGAALVVAVLLVLWIELLARATLKAMRSGIDQHPFLPARMADFAHLRSADYEQTSTELAALGFESVGDWHLQGAVTGPAAFPTITRIYKHSSNAYWAAATQMVLTEVGRKTLANFPERFMHLELECELPDQRWVIVSNADQLNHFGSYPFAAHDMLPLSTRPHTLMERLLAHTQGMLPVLRTAVEQTIDSHNRQQALRRNYMRQNGISMAQWQKLLAPMKANALSVFWRTVRARVNALLRAVV